MPSNFISSTQTTVSSLPPRKRAKTEAEKEQRRIERIIRNRKAAHASREKKRKHVEQLESYVKALEENLSEMFNNQYTIFKHLKSLDPSADFDVIQKVNRPDDFTFTDEEISCETTKSSKRQKTESETEFEIKNQDIGRKSVEEEKHNNQEFFSSPLFSTIPSPTISNSDFSNPNTPSINYSNSDFYTLDAKSMFDGNLDLHKYLEPELSIQTDLNEFDVDDVLKSTESNDMGSLGMFNSVHSAVMHIY